MNVRDALIPLLASLEEIGHSFVVKDFVGFLRWDPSLGAILLPYVGHHAPYCLEVKQDARAFARCIDCSHVHERYCRRLRKSFCTPCFLGIAEYAIPLIVDDICIGSLSVGMYCGDMEEARRRTRVLVKQYGLEEQRLLSALEATVTGREPMPEVVAVFHFMANLLCELVRPHIKKYGLEKDEANIADAAFDRIISYIFNNYASSTLSVASIAKACNYSQSHVSHTFSARMNMNIRTYINQLRVLMAKHELRRGCNVSVTAIECGFNDANYFSNVFRSFVGVSPSQYAKNLRENGDVNMITMK